jgi:hypothetical protein
MHHRRIVLAALVLSAATTASSAASAQKDKVPAKSTRIGPAVAAKPLPGKGKPAAKPKAATPFDVEKAPPPERDPKWIRLVEAAKGALRSLAVAQGLAAGPQATRADAELTAAMRIEASVPRAPLQPLEVRLGPVRSVAVAAEMPTIVAGDGRDEHAQLLGLEVPLP